MKKMIAASASQMLSRKEQKTLTGGAGYKYICIGDYFCENNLYACNLYCQSEYGKNCRSWNAPCP